MVLKVQNANDVAVYTVSGAGSKSIPDWLARRNKKQLRHDEAYRSRIELLQDFEFPEASNRIRLSRDGAYLMATGTYKPHIRLFEFSQMSLKFERHSVAENITFEILSDDWTKSVHLQADRSIDVHTAGGIHYSTRIPTFGRDISYHAPSADLVVGAASHEVYRLNLDQGRFMNSLHLETAKDGVNATHICPAHQLLGFATQNGTVEFWDPRYRSRVGLLNVTSSGSSAAVTALKFADDGLNVAVGDAQGMTTLFDLRSPQPLLVKDQGYGLPVKALHWLSSPGDDNVKRVLSADSKIIKIWDARRGTPFTSIEPPNDINDVQPCPQTGLIFVANEGIPMHTFYVPALGPAPRWCSFLDNLTEELEETEQSIYSNYKFVTRRELADLGLSHLVGTNVVRAYMHGFFLDFRLYEKAKLIADPFAYDEHRQRAIRQRIDKERESRIRTGAAKAKTKVNNALAQRLLRQEERANRRTAAPADGVDGAAVVPQKADGGKSALQDDRFKSAFVDEDFRIDEASHEFAMLNPTRSTKRQQESDDEDDAADAGASSDSDGGSDSDDEAASAKASSDEEERRTTGALSSRRTREEPIRTVRELPSKADRAKAKRGEQQQRKKPQMRVMQDESGSVGGRVSSARRDADLDFSTRVAEAEARQASKAELDSAIVKDSFGKGTREMTFVPRRSAGRGGRGADKSGARDDHDDGDWHADKDDALRNGRKKQRFDNRRSASGNVFRRMRS